ncbi:hypothetical protein MFM001_25800 [Mycobacterium sp. MFM001]|uniref:hypothetical protein n=1 Tax=Mycobacterium sp. MFM001 TaxID=2049453 RepID=UPI000DA5104C|nr:hypothetical protein [Mycobacterium sp. MFM001]GBE66118.1 hypothetical protein MFM001_25800 [Mycobacterium sp. MFM001]
MTGTGLLRTFFGPSRTRGESTVGVVVGALLIALLAGYIRHVGGWRGWSVAQILVLAVMVFDLVGGIVTTSSTTANHWYHRPGPAALRFRIAFVIAHALLYLVPAALLFDIGWAWAAVNATLLISVGAAVEFAPADVKRLAAVGLTLAAVLVNLIWLPVPPALAWIPLFLFVKVLVCFLVPARD